MPQPDAAARALMRPLHLAVDAHELLRDRRGIGTYVRALLARFAQRDDVALTLLVRGWLPALSGRRLRAAIGAPAAAKIRFANRIPARADVVWHPWNGTFFEGDIPAVATLHDVIPFALPAADAAKRASEQYPIWRTAATAQAIICDSAFTAADAERYLNVVPGRLHVIALGVEPAFRPGDLSALPASLRGRRYVLYVGAHDPQKNVATLVAAHERAFPAGDVALVLTRPNPLAAGALVFDGASLETLVALYRGATLVAVPSLYEGFGLPLLEAMACGAPVLASKATALPDVGGDAAAYVDAPRDVEAWRNALRSLADDEVRQAQLRQAGPLRASLFSWDACAEQTLAVLRASAVRSQSRTG